MSEDVARALLGPPVLLWARLQEARLDLRGPRPCGLPWALVGRALVGPCGPLWAGPLWALMAPHGPGPLWAPLGPYWPGPSEPLWARPLWLPWVFMGPGTGTGQLATNLGSDRAWVLI